MSVKDADTAEVTVTQLASVVGIPVDKLLQQMQKAGLSHSSAESAVSDDEKQALLTFLKQSHGNAEGEKKKITLKRKSVSKIKVSGSQGARAKTVNVEVRKKRTYVKREEPEAVAVEDTAELADEEALAVEQVEQEQKLKTEESRISLDAAKKQKEDALRNAAEQKRKTEKENQRQQELSRKRSAVQKTKAASTEKTKKVKETKAQKEESAKRRAEEQERLKIESAARKEAEDKARQETLAQAEAIAKDLEKRGVSGTEEVVGQGEELDLGSNIVKSAFEESLVREDKSIKKESATKRQARKLKRLKSQHAFEKPVDPVNYTVPIGEMIAVTDLAQHMKIKGVEVVRD